MPVYKTKTEKTKDNKIWYFKCNYRDIEGSIKQKKSKKFSTKEEATKEEAKFLLSIGEISKNKKITFNNVYEDFILKKQEEVRETTLNKIKNYYKHIQPYLGNILIDKLTLAQYQKWKAELNNKKLCCSYKNKIYKLLCEINEYAQTYYDVSSKVIIIGFSGNSSPYFSARIKSIIEIVW